LTDAATHQSAGRISTQLLPLSVMSRLPSSNLKISLEASIPQTRSETNSYLRQTTGCLVKLLSALVKAEDLIRSVVAVPI
jgi:hypothetical protein